MQYGCKRGFRGGVRFLLPAWREMIVLFTLDAHMVDLVARAFCQLCSENDSNLQIAPM
jgi:hypothetical protein